MEFERELIVLFDTLQVRYYGIIIVTAMLVAATIATRLVERNNEDPDHVWGTLTWAIVPGIVGARLWFVLFPPISLVEQGITRAWFLENITDLSTGPIAVWSGGLSIFGAVIGGLAGAYIYMRRNDLPLGPWLDVAGVTLPLGQAIGRWANFLNQELYGTTTTLPWGIKIDSAHRVGEYTNTVEFGVNETKFHPLFLYESLWNLAAFAVLVSVYVRFRHRLRPGDIFLAYLAQYSFIRFLLEFIRIEQALVGGVNTSQVVTGLAFVAATIALIYRIRTNPVVLSEDHEDAATEAEQQTA